jgi:hypothetical protein
MTVRSDPALRWRPLSEHNQQPIIVPRQWIIHTAVDGPGPTDLGNYFERATSLESHTWLRWDRHEQLMDFDRQADANYKANRFYKDLVYWGAISTETEDDGTPVQRPWNPYQLDELVRFGVWLNRTFGIPARLCRTWDDWGMGWHAMYPMIWSNQRGKTCPGETRILQFTNVVLPRIQAELNGDDDMSQQDVDELKDAVAWQGKLIGEMYQAVLGTDLPHLEDSNPRHTSIWTGVRYLRSEVIGGSPEDQNSPLSIWRRIQEKFKVPQDPSPTG